MDDSEVVLLTDKEWSAIDGEICRVTDFSPAALVVEGKVVAPKTAMPYAGVTLECPKIAQPATGFITHKVDFAMLWAAFNERTPVEGTRADVTYAPESGNPDFVENSRLARHGVASGEEVWLVWTRKHYKKGVGLVPSVILPKLIVMVYPTGAYELATNPDFRPELGGEARWLARRPLVKWTPEIMEE